MLLLIDNYDSFVHNLARYLRRLGQETLVVRNDAIDPSRIRSLKPAGIIISPGPCTPAEAGCSLDVVRELKTEFALLGVCLGHQAIAAAFGGDVVRAPQPMHGRVSSVCHSGRRLFADLPSPLTVGRYHSLVVCADTLPAELQATAHTADGTIMALEHCSLPIFGVQFHPESILTEGGFVLLRNWLKLAGIAVPNGLSSFEDEWPPVVPLESPIPETPITF